MNLLYDISVLGRGQKVSRSRTGVFRTVEEVAMGLARSGEVQVEFCASECNYSQCQEYLATTPKLSNVTLAKSCSPWARLRDHVSSAAVKGDESTVGWLRYPAVKQLYDMGKGYVSPLNARHLSAAAVYHSPFDHLPLPVLRQRKNLHLFLTVYDLIPILLPHYFDTPQDVYQRQRIAPLQEDGYYLSISAATKEDLCTCFPRIAPERVFVTPLAASNSFYASTDETALVAVRERYGIPREKQYFLSVCTLEPRKNITQTIKSFLSIVRQESVSDLVLVLVGAYGWQYGDIIASIDGAAELQSRIILAGYVSDEELAPLYSGALAFVYPSLYEGFGLPPLEAMQCGTPVITSNTSSLPEVVGDAGIMVDPIDGDALSQAMFNVYLSTELRHEMKCKGLLRAAEFSWDKTVTKTIAAYRSVVGG